MAEEDDADPTLKHLAVEIMPDDPSWYERQVAEAVNHHPVPMELHPGNEADHPLDAMRYAAFNAGRGSKPGLALEDVARRFIIGVDPASPDGDHSVAVLSTIESGVLTIMAEGLMGRMRNVTPVNGVSEPIRPLRNFVPGNVELHGRIWVDEAAEIADWGRTHEAIRRHEAAYEVQAAEYMRKVDPPRIVTAKASGGYGGRPSAVGGYKGSKAARKAARPKHGPGKRSKRPVGGKA